MATPITPLYVNEAEAAKLLRHNISWLRSNANALEQQFGFPKIDVATGMRHRGAIEKWADERSSRNLPRHKRDIDDDKENWDAF